MSKKTGTKGDPQFKLDYIRVKAGEPITRVAKEYTNSEKFLADVKEYSRTTRGVYYNNIAKLKVHLKNKNNFSRLMEKYSTLDIPHESEKWGVGIKGYTDTLKEHDPIAYRVAADKRHKYKMENWRADSEKKNAPKTHWILSKPWGTPNVDK